MKALTDRQLAAVRGLLVTRGPRKGQLKRTKAKFGTDAYIAGEARTLALNPYRMPSEFVLLFNREQQDFLFEMEGVWKRGAADKVFAAAVTKQLKGEA